MKSIAFILGISCILCLGSCSRDYKKLSPTEVDKENLQMVESFIVNYFTKLKNGEPYEFSHEATEMMKNQMTADFQKEAYRQLKEMFGDYKTSEYVETWIHSKEPAIKIFRFKSEFVNSKKKLEVRVVLDESNRISGFWVRPWSDILF